MLDVTFSASPFPLRSTTTIVRTTISGMSDEDEDGEDNDDVSELSALSGHYYVNPNVNDGNVDNFLADQWTEVARLAVEESITKASTDDVRGVIRFAAEWQDESDVECTSFDEVVAHLKDTFYHAWDESRTDLDNFVYEVDEGDEIAAILSKTKFKDFFFEIREPKDARRIIASQELVGTASQSKLIQRCFNSIGDELIAYFAAHPDKLREVDPDDFEKLMAAVFKNQGFDVTKTPKTKDGGFDLMLLRHTVVGAAMTLVDCKRYAANHKVGVEIVRGMYGIVEEQKATSGMIVTTSFFTKGAVDFRDNLKFRMALADFNAVRGFLADWKR